MAKIVWDQTGEHLYETGTKNCVLYPQNSNGAYPLGVAWNGITAVTESPSGADPTDLYADDIKYLTLRGTEEFGGTIEAYTYPDEFAVLDGSAEPVDGVIIGQQNRAAFGLAYTTTVGNDVQLNNYGYKIHLLYGCTVSPSERAYQTINDSPEAITFSWEFTTVPVNVAGYKPTACITIDSTKFTTTAAQAKLNTLKDALYGTTTEDPYLPLPDAVIAMLGTAATT